MGIYQSILAIGITASSFYTSMIKTYINSNNNLSSFMQANTYINSGLIGAIVLLTTLYTTNYFLQKKIVFDH